MALLRKLFYRKPPDGLLEISDRVYGNVMSFHSSRFGLELFLGGTELEFDLLVKFMS